MLKEKSKIGKKFNRESMKKILAILMAVILSIACVGCGSSNSSKDSSSKAPSTSGNDSAKNENLEYKVGDVINFEGMELTVTNVQRNYDTGNKYSKPDSGQEFVKVTVTIKNISESNASVNPFDFKMQNSNGAQETLVSESYSLDDKFDSAELISGGTKAGSMVFEVPQNDSNLKLIYKPNNFKDKQISINL